MKKMRLFLAISIVILFSGATFAQHIANSKHDFSQASWNSSGEICIVCHTPHNANTTVLNSPLWNHNLSLVGTYTMYSSATMNASTAGQPDGSSKLCLSCHDGTVALENFGGITTGTHLISLQYPAANVGTNLSNDHPISIVYDASLANADHKLWDPTTTQSGLGGTITTTMLKDNKLQCSSCHDVHNGTGLDDLLVKSNASSALCLTCHNL